jgi:predicted dehydrogenase
MVMAALEAGKHVFCEWPLGANTEQAVRMRDLAARKGVLNMVVLQARGAPIINRVKDLVAQGYVGRVLSCNMIAPSAFLGAALPQSMAWYADRTKGGTVLSIPGGHSIDALCYCLGEFKEMSALVSTQRPRPMIVETGESIEMTSPDQVLVSGILESGAVASVHIKGGMTKSAGFLFEINGTEGDLVVAADPNQLTGVQYADLTLRAARRQDRALADSPIPDSYRWVTPDVPAGPAYNVGQLFVGMAEGIREGKPVSPDFGLAVKRHQMLDTIVKASDTAQRQIL